MTEKNKVHKVLAHSYSLYFLFFLTGVALDLIFPLEIFPDILMVPVGFLIILFASLMISWAQKSSRKIDVATLGKNTFAKGPYRYISNPTHWGLFLLLFGFGITINAMYLVIFTVLYFFIDHIVFLNKQDRFLEEKYGKDFDEYKRSMKM